ncbi:hypothetical protein SAMN05444364_1313 [Prevotella scopos JCM 17725]|uniref:Transposase n=1 Tax=Prevotella scopos JCM 17725 TaxID=1236518 RepID=A0AAX2F678_9BACT|nr:hypothetical protein SAMN05444364_1313 [Prevotella scopos JCM 17725]
MTKFMLYKAKEETEDIITPLFLLYKYTIT